MAEIKEEKKVKNSKKSEMITAMVQNIEDPGADVIVNHQGRIYTIQDQAVVKISKAVFNKINAKKYTHYPSREIDEAIKNGAPKKMRGVERRRAMATEVKEDITTEKDEFIKDVLEDK